MRGHRAQPGGSNRYRSGRLRVRSGDQAVSETDGPLYAHLAAALPQNYIAFEYPYGEPEWWYDIVEGLPDPIVKKGFIDVWDRPGLGVTFKAAAAKRRLAEEDRQFFD